MKKVAFCTLGCKVNQYETNAMQDKFIRAGYELINFENKADIYVINTCTVTNMSDKKSRQMIRRAKQLNNDALVVAVGCYAQTAKEELKKIEEIDLILGNNEKKNIIEYVENYNKQNKYHVKDIMTKKEYDEFGFITHIEKTRAIVKVQDGCDRFCSYCAIPYARGRVRSRRLEDVIKEVQELAKKEIKEVVITGIHVASYGKDFKDNIGLIDLLENINKIEEIQRIRLGSLEPTIITKDFMIRLSKLNKICHHFHLSLQSGCNSTLNRMNRKYSIEEFEEAVNFLRSTYSDVILTTDIIVGFPGETQEEFDETYKFLSKTKFYKMHIFKYSRRNGTKAYRMINQVLPEVKETRSKKLLDLSQKNQNEHNEMYVGKKLDVLFEEEEGEYIKGHTQNYLVIKVKKKNNNYNNKIKQIEIEKNVGEELIGNIV